MAGKRFRAGVLVLTGIALLATAGPASAGVAASAAGTAEQVTTASWGAAGATTGGTATTGQPFVISWSLITLGPTSQYFKVVNTGSLDLSGETYVATESGGPTVVLTACVGASWNTGTGTCGGSQVTLATSGAGSSTDPTVITAGSSLNVRAQTTGLLSLGTFTTSVTITTTRNQVRAASTTNT